MAGRAGKRGDAVTTTIWAVTSGEYSDFRIVAVFATKADADAARERGMGDDVQEYPYYASGRRPVRVSVRHWKAVLDAKTGENVTCRWRRTESGEWSYDRTIWSHSTRLPISKSLERNGDIWFIEVMGLPNDRTLKAFRDFVAKTRAEIVEGYRA